MTATTAPTRPVFLYDADCGVCETVAERLRVVVRPDVDIVPSRDADLTALGVTGPECSQAPILVRTDGTHVAGPEAMAGVMRAGAVPFPAMGLVMQAPGVRHLLTIAFPQMYRRRHLLPGMGDTCRVPEVAAA